jgi:LCP family protein required for cell wall assembly
MDLPEKQMGKQQEGQEAGNNRVDFQRNLNKLQKKSRWPAIKIIALLMGILAIIALILLTKTYSLASKVFVNKLSFWKKITSVISIGAGTKLQGEDQDRINILLLGYGGPGHDGPFLTDTMILASIEPQQKLVTLFSVPRDFYFTTSVGNKINAAYAEGLKDGKDPLGGGEDAESAVSKISGQSIPYFAAIDFSGAVEAVNEVGGLDINVPDTFTDYSFPNDATNGYLPPLTFTAGEQHMDGTRALEFARSRHAAGSEGSDFARSRRQQLVLEAFKNKLQTSGSNPITIVSLVNTLANHFNTNINPNELLHLQQLFASGNYQILTKNLDISTNLICNSTLPEDGEYVLKPCDGISDQQIENFFDLDANTSSSLAIAAAAAKSENASVIIENSDPADLKTTALFQTLEKELDTAGINYYPVIYKGQPISQSVLYEKDSRPKTEAFIETLLGSNIVAQPLPTNLKAQTNLVVFVKNPAQ